MNQFSIGARVIPTRESIQNGLLVNSTGTVVGYGSGENTRYCCKVLWGQSTIPDLIHPVFLSPEVYAEEVTS